MKKFISPLRILWFCVLAPMLPAQTKLDKDSLSRYANAALAQWNVPGMAISVVLNDSMIYAKGFGVKTVGKNDPVDANTNFSIASLTKAMTAASMGILVDEGRVRWDDPMSNYLPEFKMYDPYVTQAMTIRDLLCHRSGLETFSGDLVWYGTHYDRSEVLRRARYLQPKYGFRAKYGYQNIMYLAAGEVVGRVSGKGWDDFIRERIFIPLGMTRTITRFTDIHTMTNIATPHAIVDFKPVPVEYRNWDNVAPMGSTVSNVVDMAQWMRLQLGRGTYEGRTIYSAAVAREMWQPHTLMDISENGERAMPSRHFLAYGLGWTMHDYHGKKILTHSGGADGMVSRLVLIPEDRFGFVILTNSINGLTTPMIYHIIDMHLGKNEKDWDAFYWEFNKRAELKEIADRKKTDSLRVKNTKPTLKAEAYAGIYGGELYGDVEVKTEKDKLTIRFLPTSTFTGTLTHWHYDTFQITLQDKNLPTGFATFTLDAAGKPDELKIDIPNPDFDFTELKLKRKR